jgi:subtilisin family serine protease
MGLPKPILNGGGSQDDLDGWQEILIREKSRTSEFVNLLRKEKGVLYAYVEQPLPFKPCTDDPNYRLQWHLNSPTNTLADIRAEQAWSINKGRNDVIIAVCDGGVDYNHPDLDPGDRSRVIAGYDFGSNDNNPIDDLSDNATLSFAGHGTHVAGIIGAIANNKKGVSGIMWNCKIMPVKMVGGGGIYGPFGGTILDYSTTAKPSDVANAIDYAVNNGASVINLSYGFSAIGFPIDEVILKIPLLYSTISNAYNRNVVVVAAMGNEYEKGNPTVYPAGFAHKVIAVGNTNTYLQRAASSNTGNHIFVSAPGTDIWSTVRGGGTDVKSGTSMSAPVVSGVAGLIISQGLDRGFNLTNDDVRHIIEKSADDITRYGIGWDSETGYGKVNAYRALALLDLPNVLYHGVSYGGATTKTNLSKWIFIGGGSPWSIAPGMYYNVDCYEVIKHINFDIPFCSTPTVWIRERESITISFANPNDGFPYAEITNVTETGFDVRYCTYYVRYNSLGQTLNTWVPATPSSTKIAYTAIGKPNHAAAAGPLSGPSTVCSSGGIFTISNLSSDCSVSWSTSTNISPSSASGNPVTFSAIGNGVGYIQAIITSSCGSNTLPRKEVVVGIPTPSINAQLISASGEPTTVEFTATAYSNASYNWYVNGVLQQNEIDNMFDWYFPCRVTKTIKCSLTNSCGTSAFSNSIAPTGECTRIANYSVSPNPASSMVTLSVANTNTIADSAMITYSSFDFVRVFDLQGNLKKLLKYSKTINASINIADLKGGVYIFEIGNNEYTEKHQVIINK